MQISAQTESTPQIFVDKSGEGLANDSLISQWSALVEQSSIHDPHFATPQWAIHQKQTGKPVTIISLVEGDESLAGVASIRHGTGSLPFNVKRKQLWAKVFQAEHVMAMLLPVDDQQCDRLLATIRTAAMGDSACLYFEGMWAQSDLWMYLDRSKEIRENWIRYDPNPLAKYHYITLPESFDDYLRKFSGKSRQHLKREVRSLRERGGGNLELLRVQAVAQIPSFLEHARNISRKSWQKILLDVPIAHHRADTGEQFLSDMARQGWLRSYLLKCGSEPCAFGIGYQMRGEYHYCETAFDEAFVKCGPGKTLLYLMLEDLTGFNRPTAFHFGQGDMPYKEWFGNAGKEEMNVLLFKKNMRNRIWCGAHAFFNSFLRKIRKTGQWFRRLK